MLLAANEVGADISIFEMQMLFNSRRVIFQNTSIIILFLLNIISVKLSFISGKRLPTKDKVSRYPKAWVAN